MALPTSLNPFPNPVESQPVEVNAVMTRGNDNIIASALNSLITYLGGTGIGVLTFGTHLTGTSYNTTANVTLATDATSANTASTIVARDASGNFSAGTVSASTAVPAGETTALTGTIGRGSLAQVSGLGAGFDIFTPTANCTYVLSIRVQDVATGSPSNVTVDIVTLTTVGTWTPTKMVTGVTNVGTCATTYTRNASALKLAVASGTTWYVDIAILARFAA